MSDYFKKAIEEDNKLQQNNKFWAWITGEVPVEAWKDLWKDAPIVKKPNIK